MRFKLPLILSFLLISLFSNAQDFENRQDAIDYLNNANIWVSGLPEYSLDHENAMLNVLLKSDAGSVTTSIPLAKVKTDLKLGKMVLVEINCPNKEMCVTAQTNNTVIEVDGLTLLMSSAFDDGSYEDKYQEEGAKVANAIDYLISVYKE